MKTRHSLLFSTIAFVLALPAAMAHESRMTDERISANEHKSVPQILDAGTNDEGCHVLFSGKSLATIESANLLRKMEASDGKTDPTELAYLKKYSNLSLSYTFFRDPVWTDTPFSLRIGKGDKQKSLYLTLDGESCSIFNLADEKTRNMLANELLKVLENHKLIDGDENESSMM